MEVKERVVEIRAMKDMETKHNKQLLDIVEQRDAEAEELQETKENNITTHDQKTTEGDTLADSLGKVVRGNALPLQKEDSEEDIRLLNRIVQGR
jgi:hypothetical protein